VHSVVGKINYGGLKHNSLYLALVLPSGGWQSLIRYRAPHLHQTSSNETPTNARWS